MTIASLAMYPFAHLRPAYERLWDGVRSRLPFDTSPLDWTLEPLQACRRADLLVAQTCGWPLITDLVDVVQAFGTFEVDVGSSQIASPNVASPNIEGAAATYRSVIVSRHDRPLADMLGDPDLIVAANSADSLSGWISLRAVADAAGVSLDRVDFTGSHASSVAALVVGLADLASIDAVSWSHLDHHALFVVGHGPRVPCLPLVTRASAPAEVVAHLRAAFAAAVADPANVEPCAALRIRSFVECDNTAYAGLSRLSIPRD
jgi:ABC-type phosphate/phosphonate transport system substrate-binding protein